MSPTCWHVSDMFTHEMFKTKLWQQKFDKEVRIWFQLWFCGSDRTCRQLKLTYLASLNVYGNLVTQLLNVASIQNIWSTKISNVQRWSRWSIYALMVLNESHSDGSFNEKTVPVHCVYFSRGGRNFRTDSQPLASNGKARVWQRPQILVPFTDTYSMFESLEYLFFYTVEKSGGGQRVWCQIKLTFILLPCFIFKLFWCRHFPAEEECNEVQLLSLKVSVLHVSIIFSDDYLTTYFWTKTALLSSCYVAFYLCV